jgi:hypothetical protein
MPYNCKQLQWFRTTQLMSALPLDQFAIALIKGQQRNAPKGTSSLTAACTFTE